jgi:hypothetical protein
MIHYHFLFQTVNEFVEETIRRMLPGEFAERQKMYEEEMTELIGASRDGTNTIPGNLAFHNFHKKSIPLYN